MTPIQISKPVAQCVDDETSRFDLDCVFALPGDAPETVFLATCNNRVAIVTRANGTTDETVTIPPAVLPTRKNGCTVERDGDGWKSSDGKTADAVDHTAEIPKRLADKFPEVTEDFRAIKVHGEQLQKLAAAISDDGFVTLFIPPDDYTEIAAVGVHGIGGLAQGVFGYTDPGADDYNATREAYTLATFQPRKVTR